VFSHQAGVCNLASVRSGTLAPAMMKSILGAGGACAVSDQSVTYVGPCFVRNRNVDVQMGKILTDGHQSTASYLYAVVK